MTQEHQNINVKSQDIQEIMSGKPGCITSYGSLFILLSLIALLGSSFFISTPTTTEVPVEIRILQSEFSYTSAVEGQLDTLLIENQAKIEEGQAILIFRSDVKYAELQNISRKLDSLIADSSLRNELVFPSKLNLGALNPKYQSFLKAITTTGSTTVSSGLQAQLNAYNQKNTSLQAQSKACAASLNELNKSYFVDLDLFKNGVISQREVDNSMDIFNKKKKECEDLNLQLSELKANIQALKNKLAKQAPAQNLVSNNSSIDYKPSAEELYQAIQDWKNTHIVYAPIAGVLNYTKEWKHEDSIALDETLFTIQQNAKEILAQATLSNENENQLKEGQELSLVIDGYPRAEYGEILVKVDSISKNVDEEKTIASLSLSNGFTSNGLKKIPLDHEIYTGTCTLKSKGDNLLVSIVNKLKSLL